MSAPPNWKSALEFIWGQYRIWSATSRAYQSQLSSWRRRVLLFGIAGAVIGTLSSQESILGNFGSKILVASWDLTGSTLLSLISAALLALATYFTTKILTPANEGGWLRARAVAESFKREAYLLLAQAPPYDAAITPATLERVRNIASGVEDLDEVPVGEDEKKKGMPTALLAVDDYVLNRVREQIEWYRRRAAEHRTASKRIKDFSLWLGVVAVLLGILGARWAPAVAFIAVITTVTTSLASYLYAGRYQYLVVSYLATARKLEERLLEWDYSGKTDDERKQFVQDCEGIFASENSAWMAELSKREKPAEAPSGQGSTGAATPSPGSPTPPAPLTPEPVSPPPPVEPQGNGAGGVNGEGVVGGEGEVTDVEEAVAGADTAGGDGSVVADPEENT